MELTKIEQQQTWLDENASTLGVNELYAAFAEHFSLKPSSAKVIISRWRKANGTSRVYTKRKEKGSEATST